VSVRARGVPGLGGGAHAGEGAAFLCGGLDHGTATSWRGALGGPGQLGGAG
jgi:hypothetical protein